MRTKNTIKLSSLSVAFCLLISGNFHATAAELDWVRVAPSGKSIIFLFKDPQGEEGAGVKTLDLSVHPTITVNGGQPLELSEAIYRQPKSNGGWGDANFLPYVIYPLFGTVLKAGDKVTVSVPGSWVTCNGGPIGALDNVAVDNYIGKSLFPPPPDKYTMPVGFNLAIEVWGQVIYHTNLIRGRTSWQHGSDKSYDIPLGENGLPKVIDDQTVLCVRPPKDVFGDFTLMWDGKDQISIDGLTPTSESLTGAADNKRVYTTTASVFKFDIKFKGSDVHNLRLYQPGVKTDGADYFMPDFLRMIRGARDLRFCHPLLTGAINVSKFDDLRSGEEECWDILRPARVAASDIIRVEPYEDTTHFVIQGHSCLKFTTAQPHGLESGQMVSITLNAPVPMTSGPDFKVPKRGWDYFIYVLSPTEFACDVFTGAVATAKAAQDIQGTATMKVLRGDISLPDIVDLVNINDNCDMWLNVPFMMNDEEVRKLFDYIGKRLKPNRKVHVEWGNEVWNMAYPIWGAFYCNMMGHLDPDPLVAKNPYARWYAKRASQVHAIGRDVFQKLGRSPSEILGVVATQEEHEGWVSSILGYAKDAGVTFDEFAFAPYWSNGPSGTGVRKETANKLDVDQICDIADMFVQHYDQLDPCIALLKKYNFQGKLVTYEGGPQNGGLASMDPAQRVKMSEQWASHPRIGPWLRYFMQRLQDKDNVAFHTQFCLNQGYSNGAIWGVYPYKWNQKDGLGDGSDGLFNNLTNLTSPDCVSVRGYWYHDWLDHLNAQGNKP